MLVSLLVGTEKFVHVLVMLGGTLSAKRGQKCWLLSCDRAHTDDSNGHSAHSGVGKTVDESVVDDCEADAQDGARGDSGARDDGA